MKTHRAERNEPEPCPVRKKFTISAVYQRPGPLPMSPVRFGASQ
ncbi:hypothetical protein PQQ62_31165 [Caballeronia grimmiae]